MEDKALDVNWLVIDWGTTNFRAFALNDTGEVLDYLEQPLGILKVGQGEFGSVLASVLYPWMSGYQGLPIYMAGMVGSSQGWHDVPYQSTPATPSDLVAKARKFRLPWGAPAAIFPGVSHRLDDEKYDVMRGEEVQLIGLGALVEEDDFFAILPGTHSKHAWVAQNKLTRFSTYMTGELFSVLSQYTILGRGLPEQLKSDDDKAFIRGIKESQTDALTNTLFLARTHRLFDNIAENEVLDYLSGVLIGKELKAVNEAQNPTVVYLVGGDALCQKYILACDVLQINNCFISGDRCFIAGMNKLRKGMIF